MANMTRNRGQVYSVGNYLMTGKVLGKGHFARVEEATHRIIGKRVAIKIIDLTSIKEEYARRNLHREPRVMAKLRHPCIAALYETMMHGPRLYVVMEAAAGGDLCAHVLAARGPARGLPEARARSLASQLVSAVRHMHSRGVVHRDLKMENIMLDASRQFIKIVDFGLSNVWSAGGALKTPCGSLEYAAPELFIDGRRYGPEVDLWSIGVIVYGMVKGGLPFTGTENEEGKSRPQLRAAIARGFTRKQRAALACVSGECKMFIQHLLEPNVEQRMKIEEAARHRWIKKPGLRMKTHPFGCIDPKANREIYKQISELSGQSIVDIISQVKADPFGSIAGMYNIKTHLHQVQSVPGAELLWSNTLQETRPNSPPEYKASYEIDRPDTAPSCSSSIAPRTAKLRLVNGTITDKEPPKSTPAPQKQAIARWWTEKTSAPQTVTKMVKAPEPKPIKIQPLQSPRWSVIERPQSICGIKKPVYKVYENGDCAMNPRLPSIDEHSNTELTEAKRAARARGTRPPLSKPDEPLRLNSCPNRMGDIKRCEFYRRAGDGLPSWRASGVPSTRILLQSNATTIKRASLGNIVSPHSSSNSQCKSERAMPVRWFSSTKTSQPAKDSTHLQRLRRTAPIK